MHRYLVVANQTLGSEPLADAVRDRLARGPCNFHVVVPATHPRHQLTWTEGGDREVAARRLAEALGRFRSLGAVADGEVGDERPADAVGDALNRMEVDEIVVSTFPSGISRWVGQDLPHRLARRFGVPVTHVVVAPPVLDRTG